MKRIYSILFALVMLCGTASAQYPYQMYDYELSLVKENIASTAGFKVFKVWSLSKHRGDITNEINMANAIHGLLFKGLAASDEGYQGTVPALVPDGYESHREYFDLFFQSGEFKQFIQLTSRGAQQAGDVVRVGRKYKVGLLVQVNLNALRKRLEKDGIIGSAKNIFRR